MDNFHQNYKDKVIFLTGRYNFRDWGYLDPPKGPPIVLSKQDKVIFTDF